MIKKVAARILSLIGRAIYNSFWFWNHLYYRLALGKIGKGVDIKGRIEIVFPENAYLGNRVGLQSNFYANAKEGLEIGDNTRIAPNCVIWTWSHDYHVEREEELPYSSKIIPGPVKIGKNVWIANDVKIRPGVTIGNGAIIGIGSVVVKNVPPYAIVGGNPAGILAFRKVKARKKDA